MTVFDAAKTVTALEAAERYAGVQVKRRGMKSWCRCPLPGHPGDNDPSCSFDDKGRFYCFGCGVGGTSIDMTMKLFNLTDLEAAVRVCTDFGVEYDNTRPARKPKPRVTTAQAWEAVTRMDTAACGYLRMLKDLVVAKQPDPDDDIPDDFMKVVKERNTMQEVCNRLQTIQENQDLEAGMVMLKAYHADLRKWEAITNAWKKAEVKA